MTRSILRNLLSIIAAAALIGIPALGTAQNSPHVPGELLIAPKRGVSDAQLENIYKSHGGQKIKVLSQIKVHHISVPEHALESIEAALAKNPNVEFVEKNFLASAEVVPNDPGYSSQWHLPDISAPSAWDINSGSSNVVIAVLDSGIDTNHPDLIPNIVAGHNFLDGSDNVYDNGSNGGHGTAVSGTASAAGNNSIGVSGVSWRNSIMPLVVVQNNWANYSDIASAITYAADHGAKVISMSVAGTSYSSTLESAVNYAWNKGAVLVASAGNNANNTPTYPASLNNVMAVTATDQSDNPASFTSFGTWVAVAAPGTYIYTTMLGGGYGYWEGTSFSTPIVSGLAALVFSANPGLTNAQVVDLIEKNADDLGTPGFDQYYGWGRVNSYRALQAALASTPAPSAVITSPVNGVTVSGTVAVSVSANSNAGISRVELYIDGTLSGTDYATPYSFSWNTTGLAGSHSLVAKAYDVLNSSASSSPVSVTVGSTSIPPSNSDTTPPTVQITSVVNNGKFLTVTVSASDTQSGVAKVALYVDGVLTATDSSSPWTFKLNTKSWPKGTHTLTAKAYDGAGNTSVSASATTTTN